MKNDITKIGLFGFLPILFGGFIYVISRTETILFFNWTKSAGIESGIKTIREFFKNHQVSEWVKFNLPDLLWVFGFTSVMIIIWEGYKSRTKIFYISTPFFIGIASELIQFYKHEYGTFDINDIVCYMLGTIMSIIIITTINQSNNEKQITTSF